MREENRIVHGLWIGELSRLELLTIHSFAAHGHEFHLWRYEPTLERLPKNVVLRDANEILPEEAAFRKRTQDEGSGLGVGSYATFSDLFRVKLLYELGGIWVDLDVVCLRPFNFEAPYVFRGHRVGAVMNFIKCPSRSVLMSDLLQRTELPHENSEWFAFTRAFYDSIVRNELERFIRNDLFPPDSWQTIKPIVEENTPPDRKWYGVHMMNELWNELRRSGGSYKGRQIAARIPDKNHPWPGTALFNWYQNHGLYRRPWTPVSEPGNLKNVPSERQPVAPDFKNPLHFNAAITSMALGGAERMLHETLTTLGKADCWSNLFLLHDVEPAYSLEGVTHCQVTRTAQYARDDKLRRIAAQTALSPAPVLFAHLMRASDVAALSRLGAQVVPVIHNAQPGWFDPPAALNKTPAPFIVAVSEAVRSQLIEFGCTKPVVALRHELQRAPVSAEHAACDRAVIRQRHGVPKDTLLVGMVGQFKAQKMYTRAVRVLHAIQQYLPARLLILGEWNHDWGSGRAAYAAVCRQAVELGVMPDVILPGSVDPADPYYSAFDVFLNTSLYEGLSISVLEAISRACPVVTSPAGGNAEALTDRDRLVADGADIDGYVDAILEAVASGNRTIPARVHQPEIVPALWALLGTHGVPRQRAVRETSVLVLTENLNIGGPQRSLTNLLTHWPADVKVTVAVLDAQANGPYVAELEDAGIALVAVNAASISVQCRRLLEIADRLDATTLVFWNAPAGLKLYCAKILEVRRDVRVVDVSPGPMLFDELDALIDFPHRISFSVEEYFDRLDCFVAKHESGIPAQVCADRARVIPNGVPIPAARAQSSGYEIGTTCRIAPSKRIEYLIEMMDALTARVPNASLTIVGGFDARYEEYAKEISDKFVAAGLDNIAFAGPLQDVQPFLESLAVFAMISDEQGCPNASLEAMAMGVPVVANPSGGTVDQIEDGVNGFLVDETSPRSMAAAIEKLLLDVELRDAMGAAARQKAAADFSMERMVYRYLDAFGCGPRPDPFPQYRGFPAMNGHEDRDLLPAGS